MFKCQTCCRRFFTKTGFQIHSNAHKTVGPKTVTLAEKEEEDKVRDMFKIELNLTKGATEEAITNQSKLDFLKNESETELKISEVLIKSLSSRMKKEQQARKEHQCQICEKICKNETSLNEHSKTFHENLKPYQCQVCEMTFRFKGSLNRHFEAFHVKLKPHQCQQCKASFSRLDSLQKHIQIVHEKAKPYQCEICKRPFAQKPHLKKHIRNVHEKIKLL